VERSFEAVFADWPVAECFAWCGPDLFVWLCAVLWVRVDRHLGSAAVIQVRGCGDDTGVAPAFGKFERTAHGFARRLRFVDATGRMVLRHLRMARPNDADDAVVG
jgi:hypothetical protein